MFRRFALYISVLVVCTSVGASEGIRKLEWDDLVPTAAPLDNPFLSLTVDQRTDFEILIGILDMEKRGIITRVEQTYEDGVEIRHKLESDGLDVDFFLSEFDRLEREVMKRNRMAVSELDGKTVRIPGYALPLEHDGTAVTEMLLVPYVGACIHVPPPPANQIVYVRLNQSYKADDLYDPVWITGRMRVEAANKSLTYVDGSAGIDAAYTLEGVKVEPYED